MSWGATGLTVLMRGQLALDRVDLSLVPGSITTVVGGDGAGKTTLARVLGRLIRYDEGTVTLPPPSMVGYQPASSGCWPDLTVHENLRFVADAHRITGAQGRSRIDELIDGTGLTSARGRLAANLSGGMRQKLGLAMALVARPDVLVLDEPTTGVDPVSRSDLWGLLSRSAAQGAAVLMTTTYLDEAERASSLLALDEGRVIASGSPSAVVSAVPGSVWSAHSMPAESTRWRRGATWRVWTADGEEPTFGGESIAPDMTDALTAAAFARGDR